MDEPVTIADVVDTETHDGRFYADFRKLCAAYGPDDLRDHGHHGTRQNLRLMKEGGFYAALSLSLSLSWSSPWSRSIKPV
jgi:hypothetical protein